MRASLVLVVGLLAAACARPAASVGNTTSETAAPTPRPTMPRPAAAAPVAPDPRVGALFLGAAELHTCTAAVLDSTTGDLILTAAHCVAADIDTTFVAGFSDTADPARIWRVQSTYLDPRWLSARDPLADFAILRVARDGGGSVEAEAGGGLAIGTAPKPGTMISVTGYALGVGGGPIGCTAATQLAPGGGFPSLPCGGLIGGTSGAPWISGPTVTGLVGGLDGGGCDENVSYSPPFDDGVAALLARAEAGGPGDPAPQVFDDPC
ncbi:serine protease [Mycobacterium sp. 1274761.0]|uniref:trypsin-like serine peptidase n=1 Tax=Mycobacterium sp. 1274761.0 TaxID=1834077 RepID=UPI0007FF0187|nr:trypsin-like peptidase domain-containing protein [Mycobacterium sp. 1274761.0]OBK74213.1 trypsin [Mycobacterium sp. 1274761.0]